VNELKNLLIVFAAIWPLLSAAAVLAAAVKPEVVEVMQPCLDTVHELQNEPGSQVSYQNCACN
jgi:hypothetical protein